MSIPINEKIEKIRQDLELTRDQFADAIGISANTLKAVNQRGSSPRFEIIERIIDRFPAYALYLTTGSAILKADQKEPNFQPTRQDEWKIIQHISIQKLDQCVIKSEWFERFVFIENRCDPADLISIALVKDTNSGERICVKIGYGEINFHSPGGRNSLHRIRDWLSKYRPDLIKTAELLSIKGNVLESLYKTNTIKEVDFIGSSENGKLNAFSVIEFNNWVSGEVEKTNYF